MTTATHHVLQVLRTSEVVEAEDQLRQLWQGASQPEPREMVVMEIENLSAAEGG